MSDDRARDVPADWSRRSADSSGSALPRRQFLAATGATMATLAGCAGGGTDDSTPSPTTAGETPTPTGTAVGPDADIRSHATGTDLGEQPYLGPDPYRAEGVLVAFEDPSCPLCRRFEQNIVPLIRSELIETGLVSFVVRSYPIVYPWGEPATKALEATYARDEAAFWELHAHYFAEQDAFDVGNVLERTEDFLAGTSVDGSAVVEDVRSGAADGAVELDVQAGREANIAATPGVVLFRDGEYRTTTTGSVSVSLIRTTLEL